MRIFNCLSGCRWLVLLTLLLVACTQGVPLYAPQARLMGLLVRVYDVDDHGDQIWVRMVVENHTGKTVRLDRDGFALRASDGRVVPRRFTRHTVYNIAPGADRTVFVDFRGPGIGTRLPA